jgi:N-carbamoylputrescine amidase
VKIALIQQHATDDRQENLARGIAAAHRAAEQGAKVICFAELAFDRFLPQVQATPELLSRAETIPGPTTDAFKQIAIDKQVVIIPNLFELAGNQTFDSSPVIDADGTILGVTRMIHITEYEYFHEQGFYTPGDNGVVVFDTRYGRIGIAICYDRHYPEYMRALAVAGAELVIIPQAGSVGEWPEGLYEAEMRVAAFQNGYFTALANRVGEEEHLTFAGESFVCSPDGDVLARAGEGTDEILYCEVDLAQCAESHARKLFLRDRRPDLYGHWLGRP